MKDSCITSSPKSQKRKRRKAVASALEHESVPELCSPEKQFEKLEIKPLDRPAKQQEMRSVARSTKVEPLSQEMKMDRERLFQEP